MMVPSSPEESSPGPRGPDAFSPTGGSCRRAVRTAPDMWRSCQETSSLTASDRPGAASPAALAAYAAAPSACAAICATLAACPAARAAATAAGELTSRAAPPPTKRRRTPPRRQARRAQTLVSGRWTREGDHLPGPLTRRAQAPALHSPPPRPRRSVGPLRSVSAESPHAECSTRADQAPPWRPSPVSGLMRGWWR